MPITDDDSNPPRSTPSKTTPLRADSPEWEPKAPVDSPKTRARRRGARAGKRARKKREAALPEMRPAAAASEPSPAPAPAPTATPARRSLAPSFVVGTPDSEKSDLRGARTPQSGGGFMTGAPEQALPPAAKTPQKTPDGASAARSRQKAKASERRRSSLVAIEKALRSVDLAEAEASEARGLVETAKEKTVAGLTPRVRKATASPPKKRVPLEPKNALEAAAWRGGFGAAGESEDADGALAAAEARAKKAEADLAALKA